ncbi:hypothetical protein [Iamia sp.]|uniref:hypothetical protein n=1 Tax=Iamia sp. TaxID=2722710 RepID=UPI002D171446|nr:hypothetical protein [Iamia sp.]HXH58449.1 hypothetical protein [Iamia sp.]
MAVLRFVDGLVINHDNCPLSRMNRSHWRPGPGGGAVCACTPAPVGRDHWALGYQAVQA